MCYKNIYPTKKKRKHNDHKFDFVWKNTDDIEKLLITFERMIFRQFIPAFSLQYVISIHYDGSLNAVGVNLHFHISQ